MTARLYLHTQRVEALDQGYRQAKHALFPLSLPKSRFLEAVAEAGFAHVPEKASWSAERLITYLDALHERVSHPDADPAPALEQFG